MLFGGFRGEEENKFPQYQLALTFRKHAVCMSSALLGIGVKKMLPNLTHCWQQL
jgi:hypothetical protein